MTTSADTITSSSPSHDLPRSARMACWLQALVDGRTSLDDALAAIAAGDTAHDVAGLDDGAGGAVGAGEPLALALGRLRGRGPGWLHVATPVPGDLSGLAGPPELNVEALEAGECVVLGGQPRRPATALVPHAAGAGVVWRVMPAVDPPPYDLAGAHRDLRRALSVSADALGELDLARWSPGAADALLNLRAPIALRLPPGTPAEVAAVLGTALRCRAIVAAALDAESAAVTAAEADRRAVALRPLAQASRQAMSAACSTPRHR